MVLSFTPPASAKTVEYDLVAENRSVNLTGDKEVHFAITVNGGIPAPTLEFTEGDDAVVVHNKLAREELSVHWHGILLPSEMDGVPYVTTPLILSGQSHTFRFKLRQHGTYWYRMPISWSITGVDFASIWITESSVGLGAEYKF